MTTTTTPKIEIYARFVQVVTPADDATLPRVQAVSENGKLITAPCTEAIFTRVRGERRGPTNNLFDLGLRKLSQVKFRAHLDEEGIIQGLDIVPNRTFTSGVAPTQAGTAGRRGFDLFWDDELQGFDVRTENQDTGAQQRITYAGLTERLFYELLDTLRDYEWGDKKVVTFLEHRFERIEEGHFRCKPVREPKYTT